MAYRAAWLGLCVVCSWGVATACGSDDGKRTERDSAGAGGEGQAGEPGSGGSSMTPTAGAAGEPAAGSGGAPGGSGAPTAEAGTGGAPADNCPEVDNPDQEDLDQD